MTQTSYPVKTWLMIAAAVALLVFLFRRAWRYADPDVSVYGRPRGGTND